jgi:hypothetical protein
MAVSSTRSISTGMGDDITFSRIDSAATNATAPGVVEKKDLSSGNNTITVPSGSKGVTLKPPSANTQALILKGVNGDTGVGIHKTDPTSIGLETTTTSFVVNAAGSVTGVVLVWT